MADWQWLQPLWLVLLPVPWLWLRYGQQRANLLPQLAMRYPPTTQSTNPQSRSSRWPKRWVSLALLCWIVALAQPVQLRAPVEVGNRSEPVDLILVFGTGISMTLRDYVIDGQRVDRMSLAKHFTRQLVSNYAGQRIGLVVLGNPPALWLPLTTDKKIVQHSIQRIRPVLSGRLTDMGATLHLISERFQHDRETVVVMVTDGSLQLGQTAPEQAAQVLASKGFSLYVIGMGAREADAGKSQQGSLLYAPTDTALLQRVAQAGGGQFFHAQDASSFDQALTRIQAKHRRPAQPHPAPRLQTPWYPSLLLLGLCALALALLWPVLARRPA